MYAQTIVCPFLLCNAQTRGVVVPGKVDMLLFTIPLGQTD